MNSITTQVHFISLGGSFYKNGRYPKRLPVVFYWTFKYLYLLGKILTYRDCTIKESKRRETILFGNQKVGGGISRVTTIFDLTTKLYRL